MNCTAAQRLLSAERDGTLDGADRAALAAHLEACPSCRRQRETLAAAAAAWRAGVAGAKVPDAALEWQRIQRRLAPPPPVAVPRRRSILTWSLSAGAAAALALTFSFRTPTPAPAREGEFVEVGEGNASATVYVDAESGWLVVWTVREADQT